MLLASIVYLKVFTIATMKKLLLSLLLCCVAGSLAAFAQVADHGVVGYKEIVCKGDRLFMDGQKLNKAELAGILSQKNYTDYVKARNLSRFGAALTGIGGVVFTFSAMTVVGGIVNQNNVDDSLPPDTPVGIAIFGGTMAVGGVLLAAGIPCICIGCSKIEKIASDHNDRNATLTLGPTAHGVGFNFTF